MKKIFLYFLPYLLVVCLRAQTYNTTTVYTPRTTAVEALTLTSGEYSSSQIIAIKDAELSAHPNVTFLGDATRSYNCHGYAWYLSEGGLSNVWIQAYDQFFNPNVDNYWTDGSYIQVCSESDADKIHYYSGDHSAIYSTVVSGKYESKWGPSIRVRHDPTDVPTIYNGAYRHYYANTKISGSLIPLCTGTRTFSVKNISGATYSWSYSTGLTATGATNTNQLTVQRNGNADGVGWVEVTISTSCSSSSVTRNANFYVGNGYTAYPWVSGPDPNCLEMGRPILYQADVYPSYCDLVWGYIEGGSTGTLHYVTGNGVQATITVPNSYQYNGIYVATTNDCGVGVPSIVIFEFTPDCGDNQDWKMKKIANKSEGKTKSISVIPNPATNHINVSIPEAYLGNSTLTIIDQTGRILKQITTQQTSQLIDVGSLPNGIYILRLSGKTNMQSIKFIKTN